MQTREQRTSGNSGDMNHPSQAEWMARLYGELSGADDARLSADIKKMGLMCAWSDRYYVRNLGHEYSEFGRDPDYYRMNYESKPWLQMNGFRRRLEAARSRPCVRRHSIVFPGAALQPEKTAGEIAGKSA